MKFYLIFIKSVLIFSIDGLRKLSSSPREISEKLEKLECQEFYVKIFDTSSNSYDYTCQNYVPWDDESKIFCTDHKEMPYVIVYSTWNSTIAITYYKVCCRSKECLNKYRFNPLTRFGKPAIIKGPPLSQTDVGYLDLVVQILVKVFFVFWTSTVLYLVTVSRRKITNAISDDQEFVDPLLLAMAEKPRMQTVKIGHKDRGRGTPISGLHSFLDYCRMLSAQAYRDQNTRESQLVDPRQIQSRIIRHEYRLLRESRESNVLRWKIAHNRLNRNRKFVKIGERWVYVSRNMERRGFLARNLKIQQKAAIQRYTDAQKMVLHLKTKDLYDRKWLADFDKYDITELMNLMNRRNKDKYMIFFNAVGLGHHLFQVHRPIGTVTHDSTFNAMFFHGPYFYPWEPKDVIALFIEAREKFLEDSICLKLDLPIVLIGEIRGRYADLHRWLQITGLPYRRKLLFLGGYVDRGSSAFEEYSLECLSFIAALKIAYPQHVFMLRGSAETAFSFAPRWNVELDEVVLHTARQMTNSMPLLALIEDKYLATSSGISPYMTYDLTEIEKIERPLKPDKLPYLLKWILFGQPSSMSGWFEDDEKNGIYRYGLRAVAHICKKWKLKAIIRSRNELTVNPLFLGNEKLITISSTPTKYSGGVALMIDHTIGYTFFKLKHQVAKVRVPPRTDTVRVYDEIGKLSKKQKDERLAKEKQLKEEIAKEERKERKTEELLGRWDWVAMKVKKMREEEEKKEKEEREKQELEERLKEQQAKHPKSLRPLELPYDERQKLLATGIKADRRAMRTYEDAPSDWATVEEEPEKKERQKQQELWEAEVDALKKEQENKKLETIKRLQKERDDAEKAKKASEDAKKKLKTPEAPQKTEKPPETPKKIQKAPEALQKTRIPPEPLKIFQKPPEVKKPAPKKKPKVEDLLKDLEDPLSDWDAYQKKDPKAAKKKSTKSEDFFCPEDPLPSQWGTIEEEPKTKKKETKSEVPTKKLTTKRKKVLPHVSVTRK